MHHYNCSQNFTKLIQTSYQKLLFGLIAKRIHVIFASVWYASMILMNISQCLLPKYIEDSILGISEVDVS